MEEIRLRPVGFVRSSRTGTEDDFWGAVESTIELDARFGPESVQGLETFSHVEVVFLFHLADPTRETTGARRPRGNPAWPEVGIFAQRGKDRPNRLGLSRCELIGVRGTTLRVRGLDAIDGTPVLDVKPVMREFEARGQIRQPGWAYELMRDYYSDDPRLRPIRKRS